jgi:Zn-dependent protease
MVAGSIYTTGNASAADRFYNQGAMGLAFSLFGFPVRIQPWFLLTAVLIGPHERPERLLVWVPVVLVGVLLHELGHAAAGRAFGCSPAIELHAFGGMTSWRHGPRLSNARSIAVSAAGPAVGIVIGLPALVASQVMELPSGSPLALTLSYLWWVNLGWAILNLLPVLPLDGGNIVTSLAAMIWPRSGRTVARVVSLVLTVSLLLWAVSVRLWWTAMIAALLTAMNWQALQAERAARDGPPEA